MKQNATRARVRCLAVAFLSLALGVVAQAAPTAEAKPFASGPGQAQYPALSPDGARLAFVSDRAGTDNLYVVPVNGGDATALTHETRAGVRVSNPHWSPDGRFLVYSSNKGPGGGLDLWIIAADGSRDESLTKDAAVDWMPTWSGDGKTIAFVSDRDGNDGLWRIAIDGSGLTKLADMAYEPAFSPDGSQIAAYQVRAAGDGLYLFKADKPGDPTLLLEGGRMPAWSADGRTLVAVKTDAAGSRLWLVDVAKGSAEAITGPLVGLAWPTVARGGRLFYEAKAGAQRQLFALAPAAAAVRPITAILDPAPGATVRGGVTVKARIGAEGGRIAAWKLEFGSGTNPAAWTTLAEGAGPADGAIAQWNTSGLEGTCTLRLTSVTDTGESSVSAVPVAVYGQYGIAWETNTIPTTMSTGGSVPVELGLRNSGTMTWRNDGPYAVAAGYQWLTTDGDRLVGEGPMLALPQTVGAGETVGLKTTVSAPTEAGRYVLRFDLRQGGQVWFREQGAKPLDIAVDVTRAYAAAIDVPSVPSTMVPGQIYAVEAKLTNRGTQTWQGLTGAAPAPDTVVLAARWRDVDGGVVDSAVASTPLPQSVPSGQSVTVVAQVQAPSVNGRYLMSFSLRDGRGSFGDSAGSSAPVTITVASPYGVQFLSNDTPGRMFPGAVTSISLQARNTGSLRWRAEGSSAVRLSYRWVTGDGHSDERFSLPAPLPYDVQPGQAAALTAKVQAPPEPGEYTLVWDLEQLGGRRFAEMGNAALKCPVMVGSPTVGVRWEQARHPAQMVAGAVYTADLKLTNIGSMSWPADGDEKVQVGYRWLRPGGEELAQAPIFTDLEKAVDKGDQVRLTGRVKAPEKAGKYLLRWDLHQNGFDWFSVRGAATLDVPVTIETVYGARWLSHDTPEPVVAGQRYKVNLRLQNTGTIPWEAGGTVPIAVVCRWVNAAGNEVAVPDAKPMPLPRLVQPGETVDVAAFLVAPRERGKYTLEWDLQFAGTFLFSEKGVEPLRVPVTVE